MATDTLTLRFNPKLALAWLRLMRALAPAIGYERAWRWGSDGSLRLCLIKVGNRRWEFFRP